MNDDSWLLVVAVVLVIAVPFDWFVAVKFVRVAIEKPHIGVLTLAALRSVAIAIAATIAGYLGFASIYFGLTGQRLIAPPASTILIAVALVIISLPNVYALRQLNDREIGE